MAAQACSVFCDLRDDLRGFILAVDCGRLRDMDVSAVSLKEALPQHEESRCGGAVVKSIQE